MTLEVPVNSRDVFLQASLTRTTNNSIPKEEKPGVINSYNQILADKTVLTAQATKYGIVTELNNYTIAVTNLTNYLNTLTIPVAWNNTSNSTLLQSRNVFDSMFTNVMQKRVALQLVIDNFIGAEDQTPPPKATGLVTTPSFASIVLNWNPLGDMSKISHTEIWRAPTNDRTTAVLIGQAPGFVYVDNIGLTTSLFYWIRFVSTASVKGAFNTDIYAGTVGTTGQDSAYIMQLLLNKLGYDQFNVASGVFPVRTETSLPTLPNAKYPIGVLITLTTNGKLYRNVGNVWKADVAASDITGTITGSQIANSSLDVSKFASSIEPTTIVASVPSVKSTNAIFNTTDRKLYRWNGASYVASIPTTDLTGQITASQITANSITAAQIATDTITAGQIATGAITAAEVAAGAITTDKLAIVSTGSALNADPHCSDQTAWFNFSNVTIATVTDGKSGTKVIRSSTTPQVAVASCLKFPIVSGRIYRVSVLLRAVGAANTAYVRMSRMNSAGITISDNTGMEGISVPLGIWTEFSGKITAEDTTVMASLDLYLKWTIGPGGYIEAQNFRCEEVIGSTLIQDGAITTNKIAAGSIDTNKLMANSVTAGKIAAGSIVAGDGVIANASIGNAQIIDVSADKIDTRGLTIKDNAGNVILGSGTPLTGAYANIPVGGKNMITNSGPVINQIGSFKVIYTNINPLTTVAPSYEPYRPTGIGGVYITSSGTGGAGLDAAISITDLINTSVERKFPVQAGIKYEASVYLSAHRCLGSIFVRFSNDAGTALLDISGNSINNNQATYANINSPAARSSVIVQAPAGSTYVTIRILMTGTGAATPYLFASMAYFGPALAAQTVPSPWSDAGIGQVTGETVSTYISNAAINLAQINTASIGQLSALTATIGLLRSRAQYGRVEIENDQQRIYNDNNQLKVKIGYLG